VRDRAQTVRQQFAGTKRRCRKDRHRTIWIESLVMHTNSPTDHGRLRSKSPKISRVSRPKGASGCPPHLNGSNHIIKSHDHADVFFAYAQSYTAQIGPQYNKKFLRRFTAVGLESGLDVAEEQGQVISWAFEPHMPRIKGEFVSLSSFFSKLWTCQQQTWTSFAYGSLGILDVTCVRGRYQFF
jgi:hypothetical protein